MKTSKLSLTFKKASALAALFFFLPKFAFGLPSDPEVVSGTATFEQVDSNTMNITASADSIINYKSFDIGSNEAVHFFLPTVDSFSLNRVTGGGTTNILGNLTANGNLILVNTNGFNFGASANVNVGGLIASTHDISNANFLAGHYIFGADDVLKSSSASILNSGSILTREGGMAILIADAIENRGTIEAPVGTVALAAGKMVSVGLSGDGFISIVVDEPTAQKVLDKDGNPITEQIKNTGTIQANGGKVSMTAKAVDQIFDSLLDSQGIVRADSVSVGKDGSIELISSKDLKSTGTISAAGGEIKLEAGGDIVSKGTLETKNLVENGASFLVGGIYSVGEAHVINLDNAVTLDTGNYSGTTSDAADIIINNNAVITLTGDTIFQADSDNSGAGAFTMNSGSSIAGGNNALTLYSSDNATLRSIDNVSTLTLNRSASSTPTYTANNNITSLTGLTVSAGVNLDLNGQTLSFDSSTAVSNNGTITLIGNETLTNVSNLDIDSGTVVYRGDGDSAADTFTLKDFGATDYYNLAINFTDASDKASVLGPTTIAGTLTVSAGTLQLSSEDIVTIGGLATINGGNYVMNTGTSVFNGGLTLSSGSFNAQMADNVDINGDLNFSNGTLTDPQLNDSFTISGNWSKTGGTFNDSSSNVTFDGTGTQTLDSGGATFYAISHTGSGTLKLVNNALTIYNIFNNSAGTFDLNGQNWDMTGADPLSNAGTIKLRGSETITGLTQDTAQGTWLYVGDGDSAADTFTIKDFGATDYYNLVINSTDGTSDVFQLGGALSIASGGSITNTSGVLSLNGNNLSFASSTAVSNNGTIRLRGSETLANVSNLDLDSGTVEYVGDGDSAADTFTIKDFGAGTDYYNLTINSTDGATDTYQLGAALNLANNLTITAGKLDVTATNYGITLGGNWSNAGTFTARSGLITFNSSGTQTLNSGGSSFSSVTHSGSGTLQLVTNDMTAGGNFTNSNGTFDLNGRNWTVSGTLNNTGGIIQLQGNETVTGAFPGIDPSTGTWMYVGRGIAETLTLKDPNNDGFNNLIINDTHGTTATFRYGVGSWGATNLTVSGGTLDLQANGIYCTSILINGGTLNSNGGDIGTTNLTLSSGSLLASGTMEISGNWSKTGGTFTPGGNLVTFNGSGTQTLDSGGSSFYDITHSGSGTLQLTGNDLTFNTFTNSAGVFDLNGKNLSRTSSGAISNTATIQLRGSETLTNITNLDIDSGTVRYVGDGDSAADTFTIKDFGATDYYNLTINSTDGTTDIFQPGAALKVAGAYTQSAGTFQQSTQTMNVAGNFSLSSGTTFTKSSNSSALTFDGTGSLTDSNAAKQDLGAVTIGGTTTTRTLGSAAKMTSLTINSGDTFSLAGNNFDFSASAAVSNSGTFRLQGGETLTNVSNLDLDSGTVEYTGDGDSAADTYTIKDFGAGTDYFNLTINSTDTADIFQLGADLTASNTGTVTLTQGTLDANGYNLTTGRFSSTNSNVRTITMGAGTWTLTGNNATIWNTNTVTNLTFNRGNPIIANYSGSLGTRTFSGPVTEAASADFNITAGSDNISLSGGGFRDMDFTGFSGSLLNSTRTIYGNLTVSSGMTLASGASATTFGATSGTKTITTNGKTLDFPLTFNGVGGIWQLGDDLTVGSTRTVTLTNGTLDANNHNISMGKFSSNNSNTRTITMGSGTWTLSGTGTIWDLSTVTGLTLNRNTSTISITDASSSSKTFNGDAFPGGNVSYYDLSIPSNGTGNITVNWANSLHSLSHTGTATVVWVANTTITGDLNNAAGILDLGGSGLTMTGATFENAGTIKLQGNNNPITGLVQDTTEGTWFYKGDGNSASSTFTILDFGAVDYYNLVINATDGPADTFQLGNNLKVAGALSIPQGSFNQSTYTMNVAGDFNFAGNGTFTKSSNSSALTLDGTGSLTSTAFADLGVVSITNNSTRTLASAAKMTSLSIASGSTFSLAGNNLTFNSAASVSNNGTFRLRGSETLTNVNDLDLDSGTVEYTGDGDSAADTFTIKDFGATDYYNLTINSTDGTTDIFQPGAALKVAGAYTQSAGTFQQSTQTMNVAGNFSLASGTTFTKSSNSSALTFDGTGSLTDSNATKQDLGAVTIGGTTTTRTLASAVKMSSLTINSGDTFSLAGNNFDFSASAAVSNSGTFRLQGGETLTNVSNLGTAAGTVEYTGDGDSAADTFTIKDFGAGTDYFNLNINSTDTADIFLLGADLIAANTGTVTLTQGTLDANGYNLTTGLFASNNSNTRTITMGSGTWTLTGNNATIWNTLAVGGLTFNRGNPIISNYSGSAGTRTFAGPSTESKSPDFNVTAGSDTVALFGGGGIGSLDLTGFSGTFSMGSTDKSIYGNLTIPSTASVAAGTGLLTFAATSGAKTITTNGKTLDFPVTFDGVGGTWQLGDDLTVGSTRTVTLTNGTLDANNHNFTMGKFSSNNSNVRTITMGSGIWTLTGNNSVIWDTSTTSNLTLNRGNNIVANYSGSVGTRTVFSGIGSGSTEARTPDFSVTAGTDNFTISNGGYARNLDFTGFAGTLSLSTNVLGLTLYGDLTISPNLTFSASQDILYFTSSSGTHTITTNGKTLDFPLSFTGNATWQLGDDLTVGSTRTVTLNSGTFNANNHNFSTGLFSSNSGSARAITMGSGIWTLSGTGTVWATSSGNITVTPNTSTLSITDSSASNKTFSGGGLTYYDLSVPTNGTGSVILSGANTFHNISHTGTATLQLSGNTTVTNDFNNAAGTFDLNGKNWTMTGATFSNNGTVQLRGSETITGLTQDIDSGTWAYVGDGDSAADTFTIKDFGATDYYNLTINSTDGATDTFQLGAALTTANNLTNTAGTLDVTATNYGITDGGNWSNSGTFNARSGSVTFNKSSGTQTLNAGSSSFYNITHSGSGTLQLVTNDLTAAHDFNNSAGTFDLNGKNWTMTGATFENPGTVKLQGGETITGLTQDALQGTWVYTGDGDSAADTFTIKDFGATDYYNLTINSTDGTTDIFQPGAALKVAGNYTQSAGTFQQSTQTMNVAGNFSLTNGTTFTKSSNSSALTFDGTGSLTDSNATKQDLGSVTIGGTTTTRTLGSAAKMTSLTINSGDTFSLAGNNFDFSASAAVSNSGTFRLQGGETLTNVSNLDIDSGTVEYTGDGDSAADTYTIKDFGAGTDYYNLKINSTDGATDTFQLGANLDMDGALTLAAGTFDVSGSNYAINIAGNWTNTGAAFNPRSGTVIFDGTTQLTSNGKSFYNVQLGSISAGGSIDTLDNLDVNGNFTVMNGGATTFDIGFDSAFFAGDVDFTNLDSFVSTGSTAVFDGTTQLTSNGKTFFNMTVGTNTSSGSLTLLDTLDIDGTLVFNTTGGAAAMDMTNQTMKYSAGALDFTNADTLTVTGSTILFDGATTLTSGGKSFNHIQLGSATAGGTLQTADALDVNGNFTVANGGATNLILANTTANFAGNVDLTNLDSYTDGAGTSLTFDGNGISTLTSAGYTLAAMTVDGSSKTLQLGGALTAKGLTIGADDTFSLAGNNFTRSASGAVANNGTFRLRGSETLTNVTNLGTAAGTVEYTGDGDSAADTFTIKDFGAGTDYYNLTINAADGAVDVFQLGAAMDIDGNFTNTAGTFDVTASNYGVNLAGNFSNSGTFNSRSGAVVLDGGDQSILGSTSFYNLSKTGPGNTLTFDSAGTQTVTGALTLAGNASSAMLLRSNSDGNFWGLVAPSAATVSYLNVKDSRNTGVSINCLTGCINSLHNERWIFSMPPAQAASAAAASSAFPFSRVQLDNTLKAVYLSFQPLLDLPAPPPSGPGPEINLAGMNLFSQEQPISSKRKQLS